MTFLFGVSALAGPLVQLTNVCDYTQSPPVVTGTAACGAGVQWPTNVILGPPAVVQSQGYSINRPGAIIVFPTTFEDAIDRAALQWSNVATSAIFGAFDWTAARSALFARTATIDNECSQHSEIIPAYPSQMASSCAATANFSPLACTMLYSDAAGDPCDLVEADVYLNRAPTYFEEDLPTYLTGVTGFSVEQLLLHEFGHIYGLRDDDLWTNAALPRLMDRVYPNGGDPGGDGADPEQARSLRIAPQEFKVMSLTKPLTGASFDSNLLLYKWERASDQLAEEVWLDPPPSDEHWSACRCECLNSDNPKGPGPLWTGANTLGSGITAEVRWYLYEPGFDSTCSAGKLMDSSFTTSDVEGVQAIPEGGGTMDIGELFNIGQYTKLCVPSAAIVGRDYKVCAKITPLTGGGDLALGDSTVYSDATFSVVDTPDCAGGPTVTTVCP